MWWNSKSKIVIKTQNVTNLKNSNVTKLKKIKLWQNSNCKKNSRTQNVTKIKLWQNWKIQLVTKLFSNGDKTWFMTKLHLWEERQIKKGLLVRTFWQLDNRCNVLALFLLVLNVSEREKRYFILNLAFWRITFNSDKWN